MIHRRWDPLFEVGTTLGELRIIEGLTRGPGTVGFVVVPLSAGDTKNYTSAPRRLFFCGDNQLLEHVQELGASPRPIVGGIFPVCFCKPLFRWLLVHNAYLYGRADLCVRLPAPSLFSLHPQVHFSMCNACFSTRAQRCTQTTCDCGGGRRYQVSPLSRASSRSILWLPLLVPHCCVHPWPALAPDLPFRCWASTFSGTKFPEISKITPEPCGMP
jgi:hypothetical protein